MAASDQYGPLPPILFPIPEDSAADTNEFDGVTGMTIPAGWEVLIDGQFRDGRFPERIDKAPYQMPIENIDFPPISHS